MKQNEFDYIIIGSGLSGLQLALAFLENDLFRDKKIALLDKSPKTKNDKTWCFWEQGNGKWEHLIHKSWAAGEVITNQKEIYFDLEPYRYKMIRALDFYQYALQQIRKSPLITFIQEEVIKLEEIPELTVFTAESSYAANHIFDSRIPKEYFQDKKSTKIHQHFKGWMVETKMPQFNPAQFTMMDYRLKYKNSTSFTYILPISETKAFIEYTFFTPFTTEEKVYDEQLEKYIKDFLKIEEYKITETEQGNIPMTDFPFDEFHTQRVTKIGTAGGWVKGSTGYSFKHTEKKVAKILENLTAEITPSEGLSNKKFLFYDKIFLKVLEQENEKGEWIFEQFYAKNSIQEVFRYLDEETLFAEDLQVMGSLFSSAFVRAFFKSL